MSQVHPTAIVHPEADVHPSCEIGPYCVVGKGVKLGPDNRLLSHVVVENRTTIGAENIFFPFSTIGAVPQDLKYRGEDSELIIGNKNSIREAVTLNIGTIGGGNVTRIGDQNLLMAYVHLGHDCIIGNNTVISNACQLAGHVTVEDWAILGGMTAVSQFHRIGAHSYIGGCSGVDRDMPPFAMGHGPNPGFQILGMNIVGLKRRGFSDQEISALQEVNKLFFKDKSLEKEAALKRIEEQLGKIGVVQQFVTFVRNAEKGIYR